MHICAMDPKELSLGHVRCMSKHSFLLSILIIIMVTDISAYGFEQHIVILAAASSNVQFMISQGSARPDVWLELYEELKARI